MVVMKFIKAVLEEYEYYKKKKKMFDQVTHAEYVKNSVETKM